MRMRDQSPMLTMSDTAPMVQKCVRCATPPNTSASANDAHNTWVVSDWICRSVIAGGVPLVSWRSVLPGHPDRHRADRGAGCTLVARGQHHRARRPHLVGGHRGEV